MAASVLSRSAARAASLLARSPFNAWTWSSTFRTSPFRAQPAVSPSARANALRTAGVVTTARDFELGAPVLRPRALVVAVHGRPLLAPRLRLDAARIDAVTHEVLLRGLRAAIAEGEVVLVRAALVTVSPDADAQVGVRLEDRDFLVERSHVVGADVRPVVVEVDHRRKHVAHFFGGPAKGGERIRLALPGDTLRFLLCPAGRFGLRRRDRVLPRTLGCRNRILIGRGGLRGRIAAA